MLFEEPGVQELLRRVVFQVCHESAWMDDLIQEATIHLWLLESRRPKQAVSWYVQSCRFHLLNHLACGRSVDSHKRRRWRVSLSEPDWLNGALAGWERQSAATLELSSEAMVADLMQWLTVSEKPVLALLAEGLDIGEIAQRLKISHQAVSKHRGRIASVAVRLGITLQPEPTSVTAPTVRSRASLGENVSGRLPNPLGD